MIMEISIDLTNLHEMTDCDVELERELFQEFIRSFEAGIEVLRSNCADAMSETWRKQAHALKGISLNLGASKLSELCKQAQEGHSSTQEFKNNLLALILSEYEMVREFLLQKI